LLLDAAKHVQMAREQRALYRAHVAEAVCDATDDKSVGRSVSGSVGVLVSRSVWVSVGRSMRGVGIY